MNDNTFHNTILFVKDFLDSHSVKDCVFIKDFKLGTDNYAGSNMDILCLSRKSMRELSAFLQRQGFRKEPFSFEYDKSMFFPPGDNETLTKVHLYPQIGWYTIQVDFTREHLSRSIQLYQGVNVFHPLAEIPLLLFHAYFEDRILREYDVRHINRLMEQAGFDLSHFRPVVNNAYFPLFQTLFEDFLRRRDQQSIQYTDFWNMLAFVFGTDNSLFNKIYFCSIHIAKKLTLIKG